jgi:hypothetical protein
MYLERLFAVFTVVLRDPLRVDVKLVYSVDYVVVARKTEQSSSFACFMRMIPIKPPPLRYAVAACTSPTLLGEFGTILSVA